MARNKYLCREIKNKIIELYKAGQRQVTISHNLNILKGTVSKIIRKYRTIGTVDTAPKSGRPKKMSPRAEKIMIRISKADPRKTSVDIYKEMAGMGFSVSARTIRRRLDAHGLLGRVAVKKPLISKKNRKARLQFAKEHLTWTQTKWNTVLFSDESKFKLFGSDGRKYIRRPKGTRYDQKYQIPTVKHGGGSVMVWGCFSGSGTGPLVRVDGIMDRYLYRDILRDHMLPYAEEEMPLRWLFQQDNDPKHKSQLVKNWMNANAVPLMEWPSQSPDLNPIENLWDHLDKRIRHYTIRNTEELFQVLELEWKNISKDFCVKLVNSMQRRCFEVIKSKGYATKY